MSPLTDRQEQILQFIRNYIREHGWSPSIREIGKAFHIASTNGIARHLQAIERKGHIVRGRGSRMIRLREAA